MRACTASSVVNCRVSTQEHRLNQVMLPTPEKCAAREATHDRLDENRAATEARLVRNLSRNPKAREGAH